MWDADKNLLPVAQLQNAHLVDRENAYITVYHYPFGYSTMPRVSIQCWVSLYVLGLRDSNTSQSNSFSLLLRISQAVRRHEGTRSKSASPVQDESREIT